MSSLDPEWLTSPFREKVSHAVKANGKGHCGSTLYEYFAPGKPEDNRCPNCLRALAKLENKAANFDPIWERFNGSRLEFPLSNQRGMEYMVRINGVYIGDVKKAPLGDNRKGSDHHWQAFTEVGRFVKTCLTRKLAAYELYLECAPEGRKN